MMYSAFGQAPRAYGGGYTAQPQMAIGAYGAVQAPRVLSSPTYTSPAYSPPQSVLPRNASLRAPPGGFGAYNPSPPVAASYGAYQPPAPVYGASSYGARQKPQSQPANLPAMPMAGSIQTPIAPSGGGTSGGGNIQKLLSNRTQLKEAVIKAFKTVAGGAKAVDINGLCRVRTDIARRIGVPESVFGSIEDEYYRFDFDGTGFLGANEVYKVIKWHLYEQLKAQNPNKNAIPMKSIQQAGYTITDELGSGNQAALKLACDQHGNQRAIKVFPKQSFMNMFTIQELQEEFEAMQLLACKNIARTYEIFQDAQAIYMVNEVYHGGDFTKLKEKATARLGSLSENWWKDVYSQCLTALVFMHQQAMMHCDVKEPNLMMRTTNYATPQVVLIDFGVSKAMTAKDTGTVSGTPGYMPPETMTQGKWYPGGDVFSLGVVIYQMMTGKIPDDEAVKRGAPMIGLFLEGCNTMDDVLRNVTTRQPQLQKMQASPQLQQLTSRMLDKNMRSRPKAPTCLKDPWFAGFGMGQNTKNIEPAMGAMHPLATAGIVEF